MKNYNNKLLKLSTIIFTILVIVVSMFKRCNTTPNDSNIKSIDKEELNLVIKELTKDLEELKNTNQLTKKEKRELERKIKKLQDTNTELVVLNKVLSTKNNTILRTSKTIVKKDTTFIEIDVPVYITSVIDSLSLLDYKECCEFSNTILKNNYLTIDTTYFDNGLFMISEIQTKAFPVLHKDFTVDYTKFIALGTEYNNRLFLQTGLGFIDRPTIPIGLTYQNNRISYSANLHLQNFQQTAIAGFDLRIGFELFSW